MSLAQTFGGEWNRNDGVLCCSCDQKYCFVDYALLDKLFPDLLLTNQIPNRLAGWLGYFVVFHVNTYISSPFLCGGVLNVDDN